MCSTARGIRATAKSTLGRVRLYAEGGRRSGLEGRFSKGKKKAGRMLKKGGERAAGFVASFEE